MNKARLAKKAKIIGACIFVVEIQHDQRVKTLLMITIIVILQSIKHFRSIIN